MENSSVQDREEGSESDISENWTVLDAEEALEATVLDEDVPDEAVTFTNGTSEHADVPDENCAQLPGCENFSNAEANHGIPNDSDDGVSIITDSEPEELSLPPPYDSLNIRNDVPVNRRVSQFSNEYFDNTDLSTNQELPEDWVQSGDKKYVHRPNKKLSLMLNALIVVCIAGVAGLGIGHFVGLQEECPLSSGDEMPPEFLKMDAMALSAMLRDLELENENLKLQLSYLEKHMAPKNAKGFNQESGHEHIVQATGNSEASVIIWSVPEAVVDPDHGSEASDLMGAAHQALADNLNKRSTPSDHTKETSISQEYSQNIEETVNEISSVTALPEVKIDDSIPIFDYDKDLEEYQTKYISKSEEQQQNAYHNKQAEPKQRMDSKKHQPNYHVPKADYNKVHEANDQVPKAAYKTGNVKHSTTVHHKNFKLEKRLNHGHGAKQEHTNGRHDRFEHSKNQQRYKHPRYQPTEDHQNSENLREPKLNGQHKRNQNNYQRHDNNKHPNQDFYKKAENSNKKKPHVHTDKFTEGNTKNKKQYDFFKKMENELNNIMNRVTQFSSEFAKTHNLKGHVASTVHKLSDTIHDMKGKIKDLSDAAAKQSIQTVNKLKKSVYKMVENVKSNSENLFKTSHKGSFTAKVMRGLNHFKDGFMKRWCSVKTKISGTFPADDGDFECMGKKYTKHPNHKTYEYNANPDKYHNGKGRESMVYKDKQKRYEEQVCKGKHCNATDGRWLDRLSEGRAFLRQADQESEWIFERARSRQEWRRDERDEDWYERRSKTRQKYRDNMVYQRAHIYKNA